MFSNLKHFVMLMLLASAASSVLAAPAPVSSLGGSSGSSTSGSRGSEIERLERLVESRNIVQLQMQKQLDDMTLEVNELRGQIEKIIMTCNKCCSVKGNCL